MTTPAAQLDPRYLFCIDREVSFWLPLVRERVGGFCRFASFENDWIKLADGRLTVKGEPAFPYAWDGCSPKFRLFGRVIGTPDGPPGRDGRPVMYWPSLLHDAAYQFANEIAKANGISVWSVLRCADREFRNVARQRGAERWRSETYYLFVSVLGLPAHALYRLGGAPSGTKKAAPAEAGAA